MGESLILLFLGGLWGWVTSQFAKLDAFKARYLACLKNPAANPAWQTAHVVAGFAFPWVGAGLGGIYAARFAGSGHQVWVCVLCFTVLSSLLGDVVWTLPKEFWWDLREENATVAGGLDDALHYWIPSLISWGIILIFALALGVS